jgi:prophage DNA circulation protein
MTYETLLDASFKGVPFYVTSEGLERFGRRIVKHEYPNSNQQFGEDVA